MPLFPNYMFFETESHTNRTQRNLQLNLRRNFKRSSKLPKKLKPNFKRRDTPTKFGKNSLKNSCKKNPNTVVGLTPTFDKENGFPTVDDFNAHMPSKIIEDIRKQKTAIYVEAFMVKPLSYG